MARDEGIFVVKVTTAVRYVVLEVSEVVAMGDPDLVISVWEGIDAIDVVVVEGRREDVEDIVGGDVDVVEKISSST